MTNNIYWTLKLNVADGKQAELKTLADQMIKACNADEPGTLVYEWHVTDDGKTCTTYERFSDSDAALAHLGNFGSKFAERFMALLTPVGFDVYGPASDQLKGALADFNPSFHQQLDGYAR